MISAYGDADTVATALARGADEFLTKPVDFPKLKQDIMAVMTDATGATDDRPPVDNTTDLHAVIAALRAERDAALAEKAALAEALATRNSEYGERIEQQAATIDVLKVMSASPGDPQPVFDLIVERAREFCSAGSRSRWIQWRD